MSGGHGHAHGPGDASLHIPRRLSRQLAFAVIPLAVATVIGLVVLWPRGAGPDIGAILGKDRLVKATVVGIQSETCIGSPDDSGDLCQHLVARISEGSAEGKRIRLETGGGDTAASVDLGDKILLGQTEGDGGGPAYYFADFQRDVPLGILLLGFAGAALVFGRWSGLRAMAALVASLLALVWFVIPSILHGNSPIAVAVVGSSLIMLVVLYLTGGFKTQTTVAVLGTMISLALIGFLAWFFVTASHFTGLADEDAIFLQAAGGKLNLQGLLLGGIMIGSLGVLDDMTVTQVSAVWELRRARESYTTRALYTAAARIGRDHIASTINTLVLAYAGASLPLLIFFTQSNLELTQILTSEVVAVEVVRTLVGSIGLIASVPITTALAAFVVTRPNVHDEDTGDEPEPEPELQPVPRSARTRRTRKQPRQDWEPSRHEREFWGDDLR